VRVVVDSRLRLPLKRRVFAPGARTLVAALKSAPQAKRRALEERGVEVWTVPASGGRVSLPALLRRLGQAGLLHVLVEGGAELYGSFLRQGLADELWLYLAPKLLGAEGLSWAGALGIRQMAKALQVGTLSAERVGADVLLRASLVPPRG
jgi:diaminohydroxyphosphoribosylaminopyrimidine deaminase / 5-amino-6-(5-phosphoribosylamino)uracil reductase